MNGIDIKKKRIELGLTQEELGNLIGVSRNTIINYEKGGEIPQSKRAILNTVLHNIKHSNNTEEPSTDHIKASEKEKQTLTTSFNEYLKEVNMLIKKNEKLEKNVKSIQLLRELQLLKLNLIRDLEELKR